MSKVTQKCFFDTFPQITGCGPYTRKYTKEMRENDDRDHDVIINVVN